MRAASLTVLVSRGFLLVPFLLNVFVASSVIQRFRRLFEDAIPGNDLPFLTHFVLSDQIFLLGVSLVLMAAVMMAIYRDRRIPMLILLLATIIQLGTTVIGLFMPFRTLIS